MRDELVRMAWTALLSGGLGVLLYFLEPEAMGKLFTTPMGWGVVGLVLVMETLGYLIIRRVVSIDV